MSEPTLRAADLPQGSIVATHSIAYIRETQLDAEVEYGWSTTRGLSASDAQVDLALRSGFAKVVRVGDGE
jgi:hypothetical protein